MLDGHPLSMVNLEIVKDTGKTQAGRRPERIIKMEIKHFHKALYGAEVVDWAKLNQLNDEADDLFVYVGNYMDDDNTSVYALFSGYSIWYCVPISI